MIGTIVTFQYDDGFDPDLIEKVAREATPMFEGLPGLRIKAFTVDSAKRRAVNFYVWSSEEAGRSFFNDELRALVVDLYGVNPTIDFVEIVSLVDNGE